MNTDTLAKITQKFPTLFKNIYQESDRGTLLLVITLLSKTLKQAIDARLLIGIKQNDALTANLQNFTFQIDLSHRLGLLTHKEQAIYHQLAQLQQTSLDHIEKTKWTKNHFNPQLINIIETSDLTWNILQTVLLPSLLPQRKISSIQQFVNLLGWKKAFTIFFTVILLYKRDSVKQIQRLHAINLLYQ